MNPLRLSASNYRTFERLDVDLPSGCVAIIGENGAGKSSILNLVDVALFAGRGELPPLLTTGEEELLVELEFEHAGELYRVRRQFSARGRGKTVCDFEKRIDDDSVVVEIGTMTALAESGWQPLTRETVDATNDLIAQCIGLTRTTFRASTFLAQGDGAAFSEAAPRDRKAVLAEILGLSIWERLQERTRADLRRYEDDLVKAETLARMCEEAVSRKAIVVEELELQRSRLEASRAALIEGEAELEQAQRDLATAAAIADRIRACEAELAAAVEKHVRASEDFSNATKAAHALADKQVELEELQADASTVTGLEQQLASLHAASAEATSLRHQREQLAGEAEQRELARGRLVVQALGLHTDAHLAREKANHLMAHIGEAGACDRCGQTLGREAAERAAESYAAEADELDAKGRLLDEGAETERVKIADLHERAAAIVVPVVEDPAQTERQLSAARRAETGAVVVREQIRQLTERAEHGPACEIRVRESAADVFEKQKTLDEAKETVVDLTAAQARADRWKIAVAEARGLIENRQADVVRAEAELARVAEAEQQLAQLHSQIQKVNERVDVLKLAEKAYGRDGIPALIVENAAIPQLELEANRILGELGGSTAGCRIELRTQRALKSAADVLRETLDIVIVAPTGERPYETFSGGERTRLNLALRIALARLLAHRRGAESRLLAIDEPEFLDEDGVARLGDVLRGLTGDFDRVLLVSHHPTLAAAFDQAIIVRKDGDRSRIDVGTDVAVAA